MNNLNKNKQKSINSNNPMPITTDFTKSHGQPAVKNQPSALVINNSIANREVQVKDGSVVALEHNSLSSGNDICRPHSAVPHLDFSSLYLNNLADLSNYPNNEEIEKLKAAFLEQMNLKKHFHQTA